MKTKTKKTLIKIGVLALFVAVFHKEIIEIAEELSADRDNRDNRNDKKIKELKDEISSVRSRIPRDDSWYAPWR